MDGVHVLISENNRVEFSFIISTIYQWQLLNQQSELETGQHCTISKPELPLSDPYVRNCTSFRHCFCIEFAHMHLQTVQYACFNRVIENLLQEKTIVQLVQPISDVSHL